MTKRISKRDVCGYYQFGWCFVKRKPCYQVSLDDCRRILGLVELTQEK